MGVSEEGGNQSANGIPMERREDVNPEGAAEEQEYGMVRPHKLMEPHLPSRQEVMEHDLTHVPYRSWCADCVRGKSVSQAHHMVKNKEDSATPLIGVDYAFVAKSSEDGGSQSEVTTMVVKCQRTKRVFPVPVPQKGIDAE